MRIFKGLTKKIAKKSEKFKQDQKLTKKEILFLKKNGIIVKEVLEYGMMGCIYKGFYDSQFCAIKKCAGSKELEIFQDLKNHPNIVILLAHLTYQGNVYLILELCACDMHNYIVSYDEPETIKEYFMKERDSLQMLEDITKGLAHMHSKGIAHRDLKLENVLMSFDLSDKGTCKLTDFNLSLYCTEKVKTVSGTLIYIAPEALNLVYDLKLADMYSMGIILYMLIHVRDPYAHVSDDIKSVCKLKLEGFEPQFNPFISCDAKNIITTLMNKDPKKRMNCSELLNSLSIAIGNSDIKCGVLSKC